ncbi:MULTISPECIES: response regulator transcription factor [Pontibacillus]|uniref:Response regulator transcription factor n=1 Tax=Pontibacillus chungwhensis TaxID=265426 RepID=A0ABY8V0Q6_9BACI|nr:MULTISPECIES: response regulator transcription factor [Pontibacillus]MCD5322230.1 response regulator transcription factor [Pontibacillus sp. HN14]WIF99525.1 response regulator transcription factor [Pontibacillus chungwhensis]
MNPYHILIIEDEVRIREELQEYVGNMGYRVDAVTDFQRVLPSVQEANPDLILLDINLPYIDGYTLSREIRKQSNVPIIIVTSRDNEMDELMSMNLGADDFVTKPYNLQILMARIEAVLKRAYANQSSHTLQNEGMELDVAKGIIRYQGLEQILTKNELQILHYMMENKGTIVSREQLMEYLWSSEIFVDDNTLSVNMTRLRKKIEQIGMRNPIETRRGLGYVLT